MKTIGIIGGIGPESTIDYYKSIIREYREVTQSDEYPKIIINSINMTEMLEYVSNKDFEALTSLLIDEIQALKNAGAEFAILASNTPHIVFNRIREISPLPLISIVETTAKYAAFKRYSKCGLFGTKFTMTGGFYQDTFANYELEIVLPNEQQREFIHKVYFEQLVKGIFMPETKDKLLQIAREMKEEYGINALVLGGTELPLILNQRDIKELPILNTSDLHTKKVVDYAID